jgi:hypothetical protein
MRKATPEKTRCVTLGSPEHVEIERRFDEATGGAPQLIEGAEAATVETEILRFKLKKQRDLFRQICLKAGEPQQAITLDDMLVTAMRLGALELSNDRRDKIERTRRARAHGRLRGEKLRAEADETWQPHALQLAQEAQKDNPALTLQQGIADEIVRRWRLKIKCPKSMLVRFVRAKQQSGELRGRKRVVS